MCGRPLRLPRAAHAVIACVGRDDEAVTTTLAELWPPFGLRVTAGPIELRVVTDDDIPGLVELIEGGVHDPAVQPFFTPWTDAPPDQIARNTAQHFWVERSTFAATKWSLEFVVHHEGVVVGCQGVSTENFLVTRTGETGSWLGVAHQGRGIGTRMRRAICTLAFDHLSFDEITSAAFSDNLASLGVSRKVGYAPNGMRRVVNRGEPAREQRLLLTPGNFVRGPDPVMVTGVDTLRRFLGLPD